MRGAEVPERREPSGDHSAQRPGLVAGARKPKAAGRGLQAPRPRFWRFVFFCRGEGGGHEVKLWDGPLNLQLRG